MTVRYSVRKIMKQIYFYMRVRQGWVHYNYTIVHSPGLIPKIKASFSARGQLGYDMPGNGIFSYT